ncbi:MAG: LuxR C-terminal-related transcriptional regulator [Planctomycetes bacterium]|nr:LuxR C-terminal-related transcriptional regulator [Planctomycetota bacterium]
MPEPAPENTAPPQPTGVLAWFDAWLVPVAAMALCNITIYSALTSFSLRPNPNGRMLPIMMSVVLGIFAGGQLFPHLLGRVGAAPSGLRGMLFRAVAVVWVTSALLAVLPGFHHYLVNEPLRYVANFAMGLNISTGYFLFFSRLGSPRRGRWFGMAFGMGIMLWGVLGYLARTAPVTTEPPYHPFLPSVYVVHVAALAGLAALGCYAVLIRPMAVRGNAFTIPDSEKTPAGNARRKTVILLFVALGFGVSFLSGIVQARLMPFMVPVEPVSLWKLAVSFLAAAAAVTGGWLTDRYAGRFVHVFLPACCWLFLVVPSMTVLNLGSTLGLVLQGVTMCAFFAFMVVSLAHLATTTASAAVYGCAFFSTNIGSVFGFKIWRALSGSDAGTTVFTAGVVAVGLFLLTRRIEHLTTRMDDGVAQAESSCEAEDIPDGLQPRGDPEGVDDAIDRFLGSAELTPREMETARLLLKGNATKSIAQDLDISERAVTKHMTSIFRKFAVTNRRALYAAFLDSVAKTAASEEGECLTA